MSMTSDLVISRNFLFTDVLEALQGQIRQARLFRNIDRKFVMRLTPI
jgi:hypothetical protein